MFGSGLSYELRTATLCRVWVVKTGTPTHTYSWVCDSTHTWSPHPQITAHLLSLFPPSALPTPFISRMIYKVFQNTPLMSFFFFFSPFLQQQPRCMRTRPVVSDVVGGSSIFIYVERQAFLSEEPGCTSRVCSLLARSPPRLFRLSGSLPKVK